MVWQREDPVVLGWQAYKTVDFNNYDFGTFLGEAEVIVNESMTKTDLAEILNENSQSDLCIVLPVGEFILEHFHIEEIGLMTKSFVNRDGIRCSRSFWLLEVWKENDLKHRTVAEELSKKMNYIKGAFEINDIPIEIQYGRNFYTLAAAKVTSKGLLFVLSNRVI